MAWVGNHYFNFKKTCEFDLEFAADFQLDSPNTNESIVKAWVRKVANNKRAAWAILGDITDDDRPTTRDRKKATFADREEVLIEDSDNIKDRLDNGAIKILLPLVQGDNLGCMGILAGHHWTDLYEYADDGETLRRINSTSYICRELERLSGKKVPYLGEMSAWIWLRFKYRGEHGVTKLLHVQHGVGGGQTLASALNKLDKTAQALRGDAFVRAHDCKLVSGKITSVGPKDTEGEPCLQEYDVPLLNIGAATRGYGLTKGSPSYIEKAMMRPVTMGFGKLVAIVRKARKSEDPSQNWRVDFDIRM